MFCISLLLLLLQHSSTDAALMLLIRWVRVVGCCTLDVLLLAPAAATRPSTRWVLRIRAGLHQ